jgi:NAD(P)-dependent dehydrogenase (short-subunit alcohol dehydrogenase family)
MERNQPCIFTLNYPRLVKSRKTAEDFAVIAVEDRKENTSLRVPHRSDRIMRDTPMKRFGEPEELVGALLLLVSPKAGSFITGSAVNVDGGFTAAWL